MMQWICWWVPRAGRVAKPAAVAPRELVDGAWRTIGQAAPRRVARIAAGAAVGAAGAGGATLVCYAAGWPAALFPAAPLVAVPYAGMPAYGAAYPLLPPGLFGETKQFLADATPGSPYITPTIDAGVIPYYAPPVAVPEPDTGALFIAALIVLFCLTRIKWRRT